MKRIMLLLLAGLPTAAGAQMELFPNYHAIGVNVQLPAPDPEGDAVADLWYGPGPGELSAGFPPAKVNNGLHRFSGSIFWCEPATTYHVRVEVQDATTPALNGLVFEGSVATLPEPGDYAADVSYYVSPQGSGSAFTESQPGKLADALALVQAGQRVVLLEGVYYVGDLSLAHSGAPGLPIQIIGALGQAAVLDGAQEAPAVWNQLGTSTVYATTSQALNPNLVVADGVRLYPQGAYEDLLQDKITVGFGIGPIAFPNVYDGFFRNPSSNPFLNSNWQYPKLLYVKFHDGSDPNEKEIAITAQRNGLRIDQRSHVVLKNLRFRHYGRAPGPSALHLRHSSHILIDSCHFDINDVGILMEGVCDRVTIQHSEFNDAMPPWNAWRIKATYDDYFPNSEIFPFYGRMLEKGGIMYQHGFAGRGTVVRRCVFHDFGQAGHLTPPSVNPDFDLSYEIDFYENELYNCFEDGLEADGVSRNTRIWHNVFHHTNAPVSLAAAREGPTYFIRNIFHHLVADTFLLNPIDGKMRIEGHPFKFQYGDTEAEIGNVYFFHNTVYSPGKGYGIDIFDPARCVYFEARNNLLVTTTGYPLYLTTRKALPAVLDYNGYFSAEGPYLAVIDTNYNDNLSAVFCASLEDIQSFGWEMHGMEADPLFDDPDQHDFHLPASSPYIDKGVVIPGINDKHYLGDAPEPGALEYAPASFFPEIKKEDGWRLYPNPSRGSFWVEGAEGPKTFELWDIRGQKRGEFLHEKGAYRFEANLSLEQGVYYLVCRETGTAQKVVVIR